VTDEVWATVAKTKKKDKVKVDCFNNGTYQDKWFGDVVISEKKGSFF
jgi:hypothetical protein